ncbi:MULTISPECIES: IclR family transcriptional regulator [Actinomadura]|uniref:Transcriptional regulator, IclR family n=1 Tax=Actinomadura madurae TaxID=1993 RepID=A0A1I5TSS6_9ACTN|nr:IclR family transcriptional regulator [Actinomadura madurae]SFP86120.1 transcriptional regulator, IclR family [Actinomadura madurae]SPT51615.1 Pectin degradation repressor protein kdgR [Actinomadura madurae]
MTSSDRGAGDRSRYHIAALAKGLQVLSLFEGATLSLRTSDIAALTGIPMPTAFRIVSTLEDLGYLERRHDGSVQPGVKVLTLGSAAIRGSSLVQLSDRPLRLLAEATGETVNLGVLVEDRVLYLARLRNADLVTANVHVGSTLPATYTSMGKVLLAYLPREDLERRVTEASFTPGAGPNAVTGPDELYPQLDQVRRNGYAVQDEELAQGLRSVSVPVFGAGDVPEAAVNVAVSAQRCSEHDLRGDILERLRETAADITTRLRTR